MFHASVGAFPFVIMTDNRLYSYHRQHVTPTAAKLKNCNNLIVKLADTLWGTGASTLHTSALAPLT